MKSTRILYAEIDDDHVEKLMAEIFRVRKDLWSRWGGIRNEGLTTSEIRKLITQEGRYSTWVSDGTVRNETVKDIINDIMTYRAASIEKVKAAIRVRNCTDAERQQLYELIDQKRWLSNSFLHRQMRRNFRHGKAHCDNQFIIRADKHEEVIVDGKLVILFKAITERVPGKRATPRIIPIKTSSNGFSQAGAISLEGCNLRLIKKADHYEIHYLTEKPCKRPCGTKEIGIDKGYTEAFVDSNDQRYSHDFGKIQTEYSDTRAQCNQGRNKLYDLLKRYEASGDDLKIKRAEIIWKNNLGVVKRERQTTRVKAKIKDRAYKSVHAMCDKAGHIISEDLRSPIPNHQDKGRKMARRLNGWMKGVLADALDQVCELRGCNHSEVNSAYTSQIDSKTKLFTGHRDKKKGIYICGDGTKLQDDYNAAINILDRYSDTEITRYMPYRKVYAIIQERTNIYLNKNNI